jgi:hypothetical protein
MAQELSEVFYTFLITSIIGLLLGIGRICYKSKCTTIDFCCIKVVRNVEIEKEEDLEMAKKEKIEI